MKNSRVPFFSVITSTHQRAPLLLRALQSLRAQTFQDFEVIVSADAMDAETGAVTAALLGENDTFIKHNAGPGPAASRNVGLQCARGDWIVFLDDDDLFLPLHLQIMHAHASQSKAHVLYSDYVLVTEDRKHPEQGLQSRAPMSLAGVPPAALHVKNFIPNNALAFRRSLLEGMSFDSHLASLEDWDFLLGVCDRSAPVYVPGGGAVVCKDYVNTGNRRGTQETSRDETLLADFVHVYRRWPAPSEELRLAR